jgi:serine/threonine-protein kinase
MGEILLARRAGPAGFEKLVVLKRPLAASAGSPRVVAALIEEARLLAQINHANVCQIHDLEQASGEYVLVLEYLEGLSLWSILTETEATHRTIESRVVCGLIEQVCIGLDAIHHLRARDGSVAGVIHRDISPGNLFLTEDGTVKILDLGIAKRSDATDPDAGMIRGKLPYMAPEQVACGSLDARTDLFALGLVFHDLARGRRPPTGRIGALSQEALELDATPAPLAAVVRRAIAGEPAARFASASAMASALREAATETGGVCSRAELAAWLARDHGRALEIQRERTRAALSASDDPTAVTRTVTLHTMLTADDLDDEPLASPPSAATCADEPLALPHRTEQLTDARGAGTAQASPPIVEPTASSAPRRARRWLLIGASAAAAGAVAAFIVGRPDRLPSVPVLSSPSPVEAEHVLPDRSAAASSVAPAPAPAVPTPSPPPPDTREAHDAPDVRDTHAARGKRSPAHAATGLLTIDSQPYALVTLGKVQLGHTPLFQASVRAGRHTVRAAIPDGRSQEIPIRIDAGRECRVVLRWNGTASKHAGC